MSLLGFDAIGRLAVAQLPRSAATNTIFAAAPAVLALSGGGVSFRAALIPTTAALGYAGLSAAARIAVPGSPSGWQTSGLAVLYLSGMSAAQGAFAAPGSPAATIAKMLATNRDYVVGGQSSTFIGSMAVQSASYQLVASSVEYGRGFEAWYPLERGASSWSGSDDPEPSWSSAPAGAADHWRPVPASSSSWTSPARPTPRWRSG